MHTVDILENKPVVDWKIVLNKSEIWILKKNW